MAYTYAIGWSNLDKWYYGVRFAKGCDPKELWESYFTSSKHVDEFRKKHGEPDVVKVTKVFDDADKARNWETKFLKRVKAAINEKFLNKTDNISIDPDAALKGSLKSTNKGNIREDVSKRNSKMTGAKNHMYGKTGELAPNFGRTGEKHPMFGKKNTGSSAANKRTTTCPHCSKTGQMSGMKRWHFDNCKTLINNNNKDNQ